MQRDFEPRVQPPAPEALAVIPLAAVVDSTPCEWRRIERCPSCGDARVSEIHPLDSTQYFFGDEQIPFPDGGIAVRVCAECDLAYKDVLPTPASLAQVLQRQAGKKWMESYDFLPDIMELQQVTARELRDVLDVGAGNGELLKACAAAGVRGRLSALDVLPHPGLMQHLAGEFIRGFLDADELDWGGTPYQAVTAFDVLEHLYAPRRAFDNLRQLLDDDGLVLLETGNVQSEWPRRYGIAQWWYVDLFEHHLFWSRRALEHIAARHGFELVFMHDRRHKSRLRESALHAARDWLKVCLYSNARGAYVGLAAYLGKRGAQPSDPFVRDHLRALLRKRRP